MLLWVGDAEEEKNWRLASTILAREGARMGAGEEGALLTGSCRKKGSFCLGDGRGGRGGGVDVRSMSCSREEMALSSCRNDSSNALAALSFSSLFTASSPAALTPFTLLLTATLLGNGGVSLVAFAADVDVIVTSPALRVVGGVVLQLICGEGGGGGGRPGRARDARDTCTRRTSDMGTLTSAAGDILPVESLLCGEVAAAAVTCIAVGGRPVLVLLVPLLILGRHTRVPSHTDEAHEWCAR